MFLLSFEVRLRGPGLVGLKNLGCAHRYFGRFYGSTMPCSQAVLLHELFSSVTARCSLSDSAYYTYLRLA